MTLDWPLAIVLVTVIFFGVVVATAPANRRAKHDLEEMKARYNEQYQALAADYAKLAGELRESQGTMQTDLAKLAAGVESIETMMREVG